MSPVARPAIRCGFPLSRPRQAPPAPASLPLSRRLRQASRAWSRPRMTPPQETLCRESSGGERHPAGTPVAMEGAALQPGGPRRPPPDVTDVTDVTDAACDRAWLGGRWAWRSRWREDAGGMNGAEVPTVEGCVDVDPDFSSAPTCSPSAAWASIRTATSARAAPSSAWPWTTPAPLRAARGLRIIAQRTGTEPDAHPIVRTPPDSAPREAAQSPLLATRVQPAQPLASFHAQSLNEYLSRAARAGDPQLQGPLLLDVSGRSRPRSGRSG